MADAEYDVLIVGAGVAGGLIAKRLGQAGRKVLILEAGEPIPASVEAFMEQFYLSRAKTPGAPYPPAQNLQGDGPLLSDPSTENVPKPSVLTLSTLPEKAPAWKDPKQSYLDQQGPLPFSSTYERVAGGTTRHWLGTSLRYVPNDFQAGTVYPKSGLRDWPISYEEMAEAIAPGVEPWYDQAEDEIGVSADVADQGYHGITFDSGYQYPMRAIPTSRVDQAVAAAVAGKQVDGQPLTVTSTPAGRNSQPRDERRVCAGNTNCIPICPIQAKWDASMSVNDALQTGNVDIRYRHVVTRVEVGEDGQVSGVQYVTYDAATGPVSKPQTLTARRYVLAAHAIETPRILLNSALPPALAKKSKGQGAANCSDQVGRNLMDHPLYLAWASSKKPVFAYRGPLTTAGIESLRDGAFRDQRAAFRIEIGNEGWNFAKGDPWTTLADLVDGGDNSGTNPEKKKLFGHELVEALNQRLTSQFRFGFLVEQTPDPDNRVTLSNEKDHAGLRRPQIHYDLSDYTKKGFAAAKALASQIFGWMKATEYTKPDPNSPALFDLADGETCQFFGSGHLAGTYCMGESPESSVVNKYQRSWDHPNLFLVGDGVFPTIATGNPTLTLAALSLWAAYTLNNDFVAPDQPGSQPVEG